MDEKLKAIASTFNVDLKVLKSIYQAGYSEGYDTGYHTSRPEPYIPEQYYQNFNVEKHRGQKE